VCAGLIKFDEFALDCDRYELLRAGRPIKLEKIPMELLILLVSRNGHLVTRQEIIEHLWGNDVFLDTEHGINTAVRKVRLALKDDPERPRFVHTVTGKGYRFIGKAPNGNSVAGADAAEGQASAPATTVSVSRRRWLIAATSVAVLLCIAGVALAFNSAGIRDRVFPGSQQATIHSIAVLPLANLSGDPSQDYYADGMTDEIITMLAKNLSLRVVSRTSAMQYKDAHRPLREVAKELGVDGILEGSVVRAGDRVHINVQLIRAPTDTHVWAESYDRDLQQAFSLPSELSRSIAKKLKVAAAPGGPPRYISSEAHDAYLRGRYFWFSGNLDRSEEFFEKAIQIQPDYAAAWSGLTDTSMVRSLDAQAPSRLIGKAREAARKAVELDDSLPEVHNTLAGLYFAGDWDLKRADAESLRALELNPNYAEARHLHAYILAAMNRADEALQEQKRSTELDPFARPWALGRIMIRLRRFDEAVSELRLRVEAQPQDADIHFLLSDACWFKGMFQESAQEEEKAFLIKGDKKSAAALKRAFALRGEKGMAEWLLNDALMRAHKGYVSPWALAGAYAQAGRKEETLRSLQDAYREHSPMLVFLQNAPIFDFLHSDERYRALVEQMGLPLNASNERK
jgi:TolB-like protein/DNA-binding winged helix-turn-helix (wHTH) protein/Flp pilus assembly protein TadD